MSSRSFVPWCCGDSSDNPDAGRPLVGRWSVEVITTRGGQSFRVKDLHRLPAPGSTGLPSPGTLLSTIAEVRALLGDDFDRLVEVRDRRFDSGRR